MTPQERAQLEKEYAPSIRDGMLKNQPAPDDRMAQVRKEFEEHVGPGGYSFLGRALTEGEREEVVENSAKRAERLGYPSMSREARVQGADLLGREVPPDPNAPHMGNVLERPELAAAARNLKAVEGTGYAPVKKAEHDVLALEYPNMGKRFS